jgi:FkbM family methyltransferase
MVKILFYATYPNVSTGYSRIANILTNHLAEQGHDVYYFGISNFPNSHKITRHIHPNIKLIDAFEEEAKLNTSELYGVNVICDQIQLIKPDLVFIYNDIIVISRILNNFSQKKIAKTFKLFIYLDLVYTFEKINMVRHIDNYADLILVFSECWKENLIQMNVKSDKIKILPHGFDTDKFFPIDILEARKQFNFSQDDFIILNSNRNSYRKSIDKTIDAFIKFLSVKNSDKRIKLFLNLDTDEKNVFNSYNVFNQLEIACLRNNLNYSNVINNHIYINGSRENFSDETLNLLYNACDIGINTCIGEGFGLCNLEHGGIGKPQIISGVGALRDIFKSEYSTIIEPVGEYYIPQSTDNHGGYAKLCSTNDFVLGMIKYFDNYELKQNHGILCLKTIKSKYCWKNILSDLDKIIDEYATDKKSLSNIVEYDTKYGLISMYKNEMYIGKAFKNNIYWDELTLIKLSEYIDPNKNIIEIGAHCGTSTIFYAKLLNEGSYVYAFEPQIKQYELLVKNIKSNGLENKIKAFNFGVFCFSGKSYMNNIDLDGAGGKYLNRYNEESELDCNFSGACLGSELTKVGENSENDENDENGEQINLITLDSFKEFENIGFIHCDAQGAENFIFSNSTNILNKFKPVIFYENNFEYGRHLHDFICEKYQKYKKESEFDIKKYCSETLGYNKFIDKFNDSIDTLLIP